MVSKALRIAAKLTPTILILVAFVYVIRLTTDIREIKQTLETSCPTLGASERASSTPWITEPETVTVTRTVQGPSRSRRWFGDIAVHPPTITSDTPPAHTADGWLQHPPSDTQSYAFVSLPTQTGTAAELPSTSGGERSAFVLPLKIWVPPWPTTFDLPPKAQEAVDDLMDGLSVVWQILRRMYHYPLEPPS